jgi:lipopolysaccharide biosynthesis glycosyltransferase
MDLKPNIRRAIYLDSDVILYDDILKLWNENIGDYVIGAVPDIGIGIHRKNTYLWDNKNIALSETHKQINSGVLLINCEKWKQQNLTEKIISIGKKFNKSLLLPDQDALQILFTDNYKELNYRYNFQERVNYTDYSDEYLENEFDNIIIEHFCYKPWKETNNWKKGEKMMSGFNEWWYYASMTHFYHGLRNKFIKNSYDFYLRKIENVVQHNNNYLYKAIKKKHRHYFIILYVLVSVLIFLIILRQFLIGANL